MPYRSVTHAGVSLLCFPPHDVAFAAVAARMLAELTDRTEAELQETLRGAYPDAVVRAQESFAALGGGQAWYVYRDGRYSPFAEADPWWEADGAATMTIDADGRYVDANEAALDLIGIDLETLRTLVSGDLTDPATRPTVPWIRALLQDVGMLHSTSILLRRDGRRVPVEYRLLVGAGGDGRAISYLRAVPQHDDTSADDTSAEDTSAAE